jgi:hypothetical protein
MAKSATKASFPMRASNDGFRREQALQPRAAWQVFGGGDAKRSRFRNEHCHGESPLGSKPHPSRPLWFHQAFVPKPIDNVIRI